MCCAPCSCAMLEWMLGEGLRPVVYYYNPNIDTAAEHDRRAAETERLCRRLGVEYVSGPYDHEGWLSMVAGHEGDAERGARCGLCFAYRLRRAAQVAAERGDIGCLATSLASSRWKSLEQVDAAAALALSDIGIVYWRQNWRRGGLSERKAQLVREMGLYCQRYCGCEYSSGVRD